MATKTISITVDDETLDIIGEAKEVHAVNVSSAFRLLMKEFKNRGYSFKVDSVEVKGNRSVL